MNSMNTIKHEFLCSSTTKLSDESDDTDDSNKLNEFDHLSSSMECCFSDQWIKVLRWIRKMFRKIKENSTICHRRYNYKISKRRSIISKNLIAKKLKSV